MTRVWPALWPPWKRTTISARSESQSTILPLPSSPHCEPITTTFVISPFPLPAHRGAPCSNPRIYKALFLGKRSCCLRRFGFLRDESAPPTGFFPSARVDGRQCHDRSLLIDPSCRN